MKHLHVLCVVLLLAACDAPGRFEVGHFGVLSDMMHEGKIGATIDLDTLAQRAHLYALGAVENLKGEIIVLDDEPFISFVESDSLKIRNGYDAKAVLLVVTHVDHWREVSIPDTIHDPEDFEAFLRESAIINGIDANEAFPFLVKGTLDSGEWHVIDWKEGDTDFSPAKHRSSGLRGTIESRPSEILGFHSTKHHGVFTHGTSNMHLHVLTDDHSIAAHLDAFRLGEATLLLPAK